MKSTKADLLAALRALEVVPQAYSGLGAEAVIEQMLDTVQQALRDEWAGVASARVRLSRIQRESEARTLLATHIHGNS